MSAPLQNEAAHLHRLQRLTAVFLLSFAGIALSVLWWGVIRSDSLEGREDNPRAVERELRIVRGSIYDATGELLLANMIAADNGQLRRNYPLTMTASAVGYYSFRHGTSGIEQELNEILSGESEVDWAGSWRDLLNEPQRGRGVRLTIDAQWQVQASRLLGDHRGAVLLLTIPDGAVRVLLSHPLYDPNQLDEQFDQLSADLSAPLLNRVTQGQYQPGMVLAPFVIAAGLEQGRLALTDPVANPSSPMTVDGLELHCLAEPMTTDWLVVLEQACPAPLENLANQLGVTGLDQVWTDFNFTQPPTMSYFPLPEPQPSQTMADPIAAIVGQENLTLSPLQVATALTAFGNQGEFVLPRVASAVQDDQGEWIGLPSNPSVVPAPISAETATQVRDAFSKWERVSEYQTIVLSGPDADKNGWYLGLAPITEPRYALVVVIEDVDDYEVAQKIGRELFRTVLNN